MQYCKHSKCLKTCQTFWYVITFSYKYVIAITLVDCENAISNTKNVYGGQIQNLNFCNNKKCCWLFSFVRGALWSAKLRISYHILLISVRASKWCYNCTAWLRYSQERTVKSLGGGRGLHQSPNLRLSNKIISAAEVGERPVPSFYRNLCDTANAHNLP
jgi:hypothetical protein